MTPTTIVEAKVAGFGKRLVICVPKADQEKFQRGQSVFIVSVDSKAMLNKILRERA